MALHPAEKYAADVASGKIKTGKLIKLAVDRYYRDIKQAKKKGWYFDREAAQARIEFCGMLKHYKGKSAGQPFILQPYQQFHWWNLYGWHKIKNGERRFRRSYGELARKNGKSTDSAGRKETLRQLFSENGLQVELVESMHTWLAQPSPLALCHAPLHDGFASAHAECLLITESELFAQSARVRRKNKDKEASNVDTLVKDLSELKVGDL